MGKRSNFARKPHDFYPTPEPAVDVLVDYVEPRVFIEPCAGDGALVRALEERGFYCSWQSDIQTGRCALTLTEDELLGAPGYPDTIITNPPWTRSVLHPLIDHLSSMTETWLLLDADWAHTIQAAELMKRCSMIISVGRLKWEPDSPYTGKDNCAWYCFLPQEIETIFIPRKPKET